MYESLILEEAERDFEQLAPPVAKRVNKRIKWLAENFEQIKPEPLTGEWARFFKFRVGDYRVIYKVVHEEHLIVVYRIRHRREVYRAA
jgi:mRNA interferase RelE/StbE